MPVLALKNEGKKNNLYIQRLFCADSAYPERKQLTQKTTAFKISFLSVQTMEKVQNELSITLSLISFHCDGFLCKKQPELLQLMKSELANNYSSHSLFEEGQLRQLFRSEVELILPGYRSALVNIF